jgi:dTDP-4-dehydrorhamnose reductase
VRLLVTGTEGQLVRCLAERAAETGIAFQSLGRPDLEMTSPESVFDVLSEAIARFEPTVLVNAAAYTAVDQAEDEPDIAHAVNGLSAGEAARAAAAAGIPVIQISTDYVFDGRKSGAYVETDETGPQGAYGASKLAGEQMAAKANPRHIIMRTAWVYSPFGKNFVKTMLKLAETRDELRVVADQHGNPTSAHDIADAVIAAARRSGAPGFADWGVFHFAGTGTTHWAGFAGEIFRHSAALGGPSADVIPITTADYPTKARRPANSQLDSSRFTATFGQAARPWPEALHLVVKRILGGS